MESVKCQRILKVSFYQIVFDGAAPILGKKSSEGELGRTKEMPLLGCFRYLFESTLSRGKCINVLILLTCSFQGKSDWCLLLLSKYKKLHCMEIPSYLGEHSEIPRVGKDS